MEEHVEERVEEATGQVRFVPSKESKKGKKRKREADTKDPPLLVIEDGQPLDKKAKKWKNKTRVLILCARGVTYRSRHLMNDIKTLLPHSRSDNKLDRKDDLSSLVELCEMKNCTKCIFFEMRKRKDLYMWISHLPNGPSAKFLVENVHTMNELKLTGNCLLGSRPLLSFDPSFTGSPHYSLLKELFIKIFSTPYYHPKSKPFIDHMFHFGLLDNHIWFRNYQIVDDGKTLTEIGPRFTLNLIKVFSGSFGGATLYQNPHYQTPNAYRRTIKLMMAQKQDKKVKQKKKISTATRKVLDGLSRDPMESVFDTLNYK